MNKLLMRYNKETEKFISTLVPMSEDEILEKKLNKEAQQLKNNTITFRLEREKLLAKYDIYSMRVIRNKIKEDPEVEDWYRNILDFTSEITYSTTINDWPNTPTIIENI